MEQNQIPSAPVPQVTPVIVPPKPTKTSYGALFAIILITALIAGGAYYFFNQRVDELVAITEEQQATIAKLDAQSTSTEPEAIKADLTAESPDEFEKELDAAFAGLDEVFATQ